MAASSIRACFGSCLSTGESFFTNGKSHLAKYMQSSEGRDKALKMVDPILDTIGEIAKVSGASDAALEGIEKGRSWAKTGRDIYAIFNIFAGVIPAMIEHMKNFFLLVKGLFTGEAVHLKHATIPQDTPQKKHRLEKFLAAGENFGKGVACAAYTFGFGICAPIKNLDKHVRSKEGKPLIDMSEGTRELGHSFAKIVMPINHVGGLIGSGFGIGYHTVAFNRFLEEDGDPEDGTYERYKQSIADNTLGIIEKSLEILHDIVVITGKTAPAWYRLPVTLGIGVCGVYKEWRKTA